MQNTLSKSQIFAENCCGKPKGNPSPRPPKKPR